MTFHVVTASVLDDVFSAAWALLHGFPWQELHTGVMNIKGAEGRSGIMRPLVLTDKAHYRGIAAIS